MDRRELFTTRRTRPHKLAATPQSSGDESVVDAAIFTAIERMQTFQSECRDVVTWVVDQWDHAFASSIGEILNLPVLSPSEVLLQWSFRVAVSTDADQQADAQQR
jgi:hypothetical protein